MLDQVKSGTSARNATIRPAAGASPAVESPTSQRVNPASGSMGTNYDDSHGDEPRARRRRLDADAPSDPAPGASDAGAKALSLPADPAAHQSADADDALNALLREARDLDPALAPAQVPAVADDARRKAVDAYAERETLRQRREALKPGVVFSASF